VPCQSIEYPKLRDKRILIVDDEPVISVDYRFQLLAAGALPAAFLASNASALAYLELHTVDAVIVDYRLRDGTSAPLMRCLLDRGIPFIVITGWPEKFRFHETASAIVLEKPTVPSDLCRALSEAIH